MAATPAWRHATRIGAAGLVILGLGVAMLGFAARASRLHPSAFAFLSNDPRPSITAHNSPAVAADPRRPLHVAMADKIDTPAVNCTVSVSTDGGNDWSPADPSPPDPATHCYWPDVAYDPAGDLLVLYTAMGQDFNDSRGVFLQRTSGGRPGGAPVAVAGPGAFHARLAVDGDRVLVAWVQITGATPFQAGSGAASRLLFAASADGGRTFAAPVGVGPPGRLLLQPTVVVGQDGQVVVGALDLGADLMDYESQHLGRAGPPYAGHWQVVTFRSTDGGATFGGRTAVGDIMPARRIYPDMSSPAPGFAVDASSGRIYATWDSGRGNARDVYLAWSDDAGRTWGRATQFPRPSSQTLPTVGVAPDGRVDLLFYDAGDDPADVLTEPELASSWDGGRTFTSQPVTGRPFDSRIGFGSSQGLGSLGQQLGVVSGRDRILAFWSDTRKGTIDDNDQELAVEVVDVRKGSGRNVALVVAGALLALAGAAVAVRGGRQARSGGSPARPNNR